MWVSAAMAGAATVQSAANAAEMSIELRNVELRNVMNCSFECFCQQLGSGLYNMPFGFDKLAAARLVAALMLGAGQRAQAQAPSVPASAPVCIYESESYSDGAYLCIRKGLMLGCATTAGKANWSVVADRELSRHC